MQHDRSYRRAVLLALSLLSACAAADPSGASTEARLPRSGQPAPTGAIGAYLIGRFAGFEGDLDEAADQLLKAQAIDPDSPKVRQQAFLAALLDARPEAGRLARDLPDNMAAQLLLANDAARAGDWATVEHRFAALPKQGLTQVLQPMLVAWAQFGGGHTDAALATLRPFVEGERFRAVYALHAALIADLASRPGEAGRMYGIAQSDFGSTNLELSRALASWQARTGHEAEAKHTLAALVQAGPDVAIALPRLQADAATRQVRRATDGIAAAYLALAVALRQQDASEFATVLLRLALDLRPDLTAARMVAADLDEQAKRYEAALTILQPVAAADPLAPVVELRRVALQDRLGNTDEALRLATAIGAAYPARPEPWSLQADILREKHRYADAVAAYDKAVALTPQPYTRGNWPLFYERGIALERAHDWPRAEADFQHALQLSPDEPGVLNYLGYSWTEQGHDLTRARQMIQRAAEERPNDGAILDSLGWVTLRQGDTAAGVKWLEKAAELQPEDATINGHLGDGYWAAGRKLEAEYQWRRALTLNPEPEDVGHLQAKLHEAEQALGMASTPATAEKALP